MIMNDVMIRRATKEDMKKLGIQSPNESDAIMMSLYAPAVVEESFTIDFKNWN